jgi:hypothetical protein
MAMQVLRTVAGVASLKTIIATASSARILDLHTIAAEIAADPDAAGVPMFAHPVLNRSIIVKHNARPDEEERGAPRRFNATKIIFPFDHADLGLGGQFLFVDQPDFVLALSRYLDYADLPLDRDVRVLRLLDGLPTLDPFLIREALAKHKIDVDRAYLRLSEADLANMLGFVEGQIEALINLCFGEIAAGDSRGRRLSQLLLADQDDPELEPLRQTLHMKGETFAEAMFAWKAFLYYRWRVSSLAPDLKATMRSISRLHRRRYESAGLRYVLVAKAQLEETIARSWREVGDSLKAYDRAFEAMTVDKNPDVFRKFLADGRRMFLDLGDRIGRMEQLVSFWDYRLGRHHDGGMGPDEVLDGMRDLMQILAIRPEYGQARTGRTTLRSAAG